MKTRAQRGFSLLELLIAMALLGMIMVLLFGGLRLSMRSWDAAQGSMDTMSTVRAVEGFLRREMEQIYPYRWKKATEQRLAFIGERHMLRFVAPLPSRVGGGGLYLSALNFDLQGKQKRIVWRHLPIGAGWQDFSALADAKEVILASGELSGVEDVWLSYFGAETEGVVPKWQDRWDNGKSLPMLIRVQIKLAQNDEWPDFVVAPMLTLDPMK